MPKVKKIINATDDIVDETLEGVVLASHGKLMRVPGANAICRTHIRDNKVALLIGGGSGHEPMYTAYVGENFADGSVAGHVFAAPSPDMVLAATRAVHRGKGVLYVYGNYAGDNMNFDIAAELAAAEGIETRTVRVADDIATKEPSERRGIGGAFFTVKAAGAICTEASSLAEAEEKVRAANAMIRSIGVAVRAGSLPETGEPTFHLGEDEIEIGMGAHGEPGVERRKMMPAADLAREVVRLVVEDLPFRKGDRVALLLNNLGATTMMELLIVNTTVRAELERLGIAVHRTDIGPLFTSQETAGFSLSLMKLDEQSARWLDAPASCPAYRQ